MNAHQRNLVVPTLDQIKAEKRRREIKRDADGVRDRCKTLVGFIREAWPVLEPTSEYIHGWHIDAVCAHLEAITWGTFREMGLSNRLLINEPPGTMKSLVVSVFWPAWEWGPAGLPSMRYLTSSYAEGYVKRDSRRMRDLINSEWYQSLWGSTVSLTRMGEASFENSARGNREGKPFSSLTAGRGDRVIIDDPHSTETAESDAERERTVRIFRESVTSRLNDPENSAIVVVMQRLHEGDVASVAESFGYIHLMLPMEFEPDRRCKTPIFKDPRIKDGELLFPERFSAEVVERDKIAMGSYAVAGQYQQRPAPREGGLFKRSYFEIVPAASTPRKTCRGWDLAATEENQNSKPAWTCGVRISQGADDIFYIEHVERLRGSPATVQMTVKNTSTQDGKSVRVSLPQDPGQAGKAQAQAFVIMLAGFDVHTSPESGSKVTRALPLAAQAEAGNVKLVEGDWNEAFLDEISKFPAGSYLDQVDAASRAFNELADMDDFYGVSLGGSAGLTKQSAWRNNG